MPSLARNAARAAAIVLVVLLAGVGLVEAGLRVAGAGPRRPDRFGGLLAYRFPPDEPREMVTGPGELLATAAIGPDGYRAPRPVPPVRIACLGDSWTFGWGVTDDEAWPARLARTTGLSVGNYGIPGYALENLTATWREVVGPLQPEVVVVATFVNDLETVPRPPVWWRRALRATAIGRLLSERGVVDLDGVRPLPMLGGAVNRLVRRPDEPEFAPYVAKYFERLDVLLDALGVPPAAPGTDDQGAATGPRLLFVSLPLPTQMQRVQQELAGGTQVRLALRRHARWQLLLEEHLQRRGVPVLELLPAFAHIADRVMLPLAPSHPDARGHRLIAREVERELRERGWID